MGNILLIIHLLIALALIGIVLLQRSEGGGLGIGGGGGGAGGGGMAGFMTGRGTANLLTRVTAVLAALFMISSIGLTIFFNQESGGSGSLTQGLQQEFQRGLVLPESGGSAADGLSLPDVGGSDNSAPQVE